MTFLPIVARELRIASRRRGTYWVRAGAALSIILVGTWFFLMMQQQPPQETAQLLFGILTGGAVLYCLLSGVRHTADCLSEEKREGTLGLLFLTDLRGYDVVLGKLAATSLNASYGVLAILPMLAVPLLMGGVTPGEFGRAALVAVNALFFSLATGMVVSAVCRSARRAMASTFLVLSFFNAGLPALGAWSAYLSKSASVGVYWLAPSAGYTYYLAYDLPFKTGAREYWWSMGVVHGLGWFSLVLASLIAPHAWQERPAGVRALRWRERWHLWSYGTLEERRAFRRGLLEQNAFLWLAARTRLKPAYVWASLGLVASGWVWGLAKFRREWLTELTYVATGMILNILLKVWFASEAGRQLAEDRKNGALELVLSTPLGVRDILFGQFLALQRQFLGPLVVILVADLLFLLSTLSSNVGDSDRLVWISVWTAAMLMMVADLVALFYVGLWQGLTARNPNRAASATTLRVLVVPWITMALVILVLTLGSNLLADATWKFFLGLWFLAGVGADLLFGAFSRRQLLTEFRTAAAEPRQRGTGFWKRLITEPRPPPVGLPPAVVAPK